MLLNSLAILFLASQLVTLPASGDPPSFDIAQSCNAEGSTVVSIGRCTRDERAARDEVQTKWSQFGLAPRQTCAKEAGINGTPSYVEFLTCLEMARDAATVGASK
jgi:hypothetical protein